MAASQTTQTRFSSIHTMCPWRAYLVVPTLTDNSETRKSIFGMWEPSGSTSGFSPVKILLLYSGDSNAASFEVSGRS